jgi:hypothetical protein
MSMRSNFAVLRLMACIGSAGGVADQTPCRDIIAKDIHRGDPMSGRQRDNSIPLGEQELASKRASPALDECCKGSFDFAVAANVENFDLLPNGRSRRSDL